jgi:hypothetical protein
VSAPTQSGAHETFLLSKSSIVGTNGYKENYLSLFPFGLPICDIKITDFAPFSKT